MTTTGDANEGTTAPATPGAPDSPQKTPRPASGAPPRLVYDPGSTPRWAIAGFVALATLSLLDQTDRWILGAVLPKVAGDLKLSGEQSAWLSVWFLIGFTLGSPAVAYVGDRRRRPRLLALGVAVCGLATIATGLAQTYGQLRLARAGVGLGAAVFGVVAPTLLADYFGRPARARVYSWFALAIPLGGALGLALGGWLGERFGWRPAFFAVGVTGLLAAAAALRLRDPVRGLSEGVNVDRLREHNRAGASQEDYVDLMVNSSYTYSVLGMAFYTFAIGGLAYWLPTFLIETKNLDPAWTTRTLGLTTLGAAVVGMVGGGGLADRLSRRFPRALFLVPGLALLASIPCAVAAIYATRTPWLFGAIFAAEALMFAAIGPCHAVIANVAMPNMRAGAYGVAFLMTRLLGDLWSPTLMGWVADTFGRRDSMATPFGRMLAAIGALPTTTPGRPPENMTAALLVVLPALVLAGGVLLAGARHLPREMALMTAKLKAPPTRPAAPPRKA